MPLNRRQALQLIAGSVGAGSAILLHESVPVFGASGAAVAKPLHTKGSDLIYASTADLLKRYRRRELSPVEVLEAQIERYSEVEPLINACTYTHFDSARKAAKTSEQRYKNKTARPLEGITVALKDEYDVTGWITTAGSNVLKDNVATSNHPAVDKLIQAGAVLHMQTTVPEMYFAAVTWTDLWGVTRNPWNLKYTVGGSSGGSGAALAAGMTTLATGSDMGGSTEFPVPSMAFTGSSLPMGGTHRHRAPPSFCPPQKGRWPEPSKGWCVCRTCSADRPPTRQRP
jgi:hypothetical protein